LRGLGRGLKGGSVVRVTYVPLLYHSLSIRQVLALKEGGWKVTFRPAHWRAGEGHIRYAYIETSDPAAAVYWWEQLTGLSSTEFIQKGKRDPIYEIPAPSTRALHRFTVGGKQYSGKRIAILKNRRNLPRI
jgi:hypothetical protein